MKPRQSNSELRTLGAFKAAQRALTYSTTMSKTYDSEYLPACAWTVQPAPEPVSNLFRLTLWVKSKGAGESIAEHTTPLSRQPGTYSKAYKQISCQLARTDILHHTLNSNIYCVGRSECFSDTIMCLSPWRAEFVCYLFVDF